MLTGISADRKQDVTAALCLSAQQGDMLARDRLLRAHSGLIVRCRRIFAGDRGGQTDDEMEASGLLGLDRAIMNYDATKGFRFSTYAVWCIRAAMKPVGAMRRQYVAEQAGADALVMLGRTLESIAIESNVSGMPSVADLRAIIDGLTPMKRLAIQIYYRLPCDRKRMSADVAATVARRVIDDLRRELVGVEN